MTTRLFESRPAAAFTFRDVLYEKGGGIARITINRPQHYNAYSTAALDELGTAFRDASFDDAVGVIVLTGAGDRATGGPGGRVDRRGHGGRDPPRPTGRGGLRHRPLPARRLRGRSGAAPARFVPRVHALHEAADQCAQGLRVALYGAARPGLAG